VTVLADAGARMLSSPARSRLYTRSRGARYGAPRVHAKLAPRSRRHGRKRVARLLRCAVICGKTSKRWRNTTIADPSADARADRIRRDFTADASAINSRWCGDIPCIGRCPIRLRVPGGSGRRIGRCGRRCGHRAGLSRLVRCSGSSGG
jgi:HTH-like domain